MADIIQLLDAVPPSVPSARATLDAGAGPLGRPVRVLLIGAYELGRQPFGLASAAAWLREAGAEVACLDLAVEHLEDAPVRAADLIAFHVPMHTATRIAVAAVPRVRALNPGAHLCFFGLYAPVNESYLRGLGVGTILGGEFEEGLLALVTRLAEGRAGEPQDAAREPVISLARQRFRVPDRQGLPELSKYAYLIVDGAERRTTGYTEASRGCTHRCRHCPIVPVYGGRFRVVPRDTVLEDIRRQVAAGARHITVGDPDFFNGIGHSIPLVEALHREFPDLTYDVTIKIEHLLRHQRHLATLRDTGCLFVTSAVEAVDDAVLAALDKGHTTADFLRALALCRAAGLTLCPTFVTFTPWTTLAGYRDLLALLAAEGLIEAVPPIQLAIRLLIPAGSRLLELPDIRRLIGPFDEAALCYPWSHPDPRVDRLHAAVLSAVESAQSEQASRRDAFTRVWHLAHDALGLPAPPLPEPADGLPQTPIPYLSEPWFC